MPNEFTSRLTKGQAIAVLLWLPMHIIVFPLLLYVLLLRGLFNETIGNDKYCCS